MVDTQLTFRRGTFYLVNPEASDRRSLDVSDEWTNDRFGLYQTTSLKAASEYSLFADKVCARVFDRAFLKRYPLPKLPQLKFLDTHQVEGIKFILTRSRSYLAHAPGAGKTAQAIIGSILAEGAGQTLFIVPPSLTKNWEREILKFTEWAGIWPAIGIIPVSSNKEWTAWHADFLIVPDSMLTKDWVYGQLVKKYFKFIAVDEASRFKESTSERSKAFYGGRTKKHFFPGLYQTARHTVFLDGSPMPNRSMELWAPTYALHPQAIDCMGQQEFGFKYCGAKLNDRGVWEFNHSSNDEELHHRLQKEFMHVVTEAKLSHPERRRSLLFMNQDVRSTEQKTWERKHLHAFKMSDISEESSQGDIARFRKQLGIRKIYWVANYVNDRLKNQSESILLFAWHREVVEGLATLLSEYKPAVIMGGVSADVREKAFVQFQAGKSRLIIGNILAMGRGHNLQKATRVVFAEYAWSDEVNIQAEKRASRRGNTQAFTRCEYIVVPDSMDEIVLNAVFTKAARVKRVIG